MKISVLTPDLSHNCLGRAYLLAKVLQTRYEVEIVGPIFGDGIWKPLANDKSIKYKSVKISGRFEPYWQIKELAGKIDGDVIYASKPLFTSFGAGLLGKFRQKKHLVLDIDDWQAGLVKEGYRSLSAARRLRFLASSAMFFYTPDSYWNNLFGEKLSPFADEITVANNFLKNKFGGTMICHGRNTEDFDPARFDRHILREKYQIGNTRKVVMFFGTPRPHKGIEDLVQAVGAIGDPDIVLIVVGVDYKDTYCQNIVGAAKKKLGEGRFIDFGLQPFEKVPEFLAMADVVAVPQRKNLATFGQTPAKVFDAMAMAKPIIATNVSDLPEILGGCGWLIEPQDPERLAETIQYVLDNPEEAKKMGWKSRQKCVENYSWDAVRKILLGVFEKYE